MTPTEQAIAVLEKVSGLASAWVTAEIGCTGECTAPGSEERATAAFKSFEVNIAAAIAALKADPWRPISEAKKDGQIYAAYSDGAGCREGTFTLRWYKRGYWVDERGKYWHEGVIGGVSPLPAPPEAKEARDGRTEER